MRPASLFLAASGVVLVLSAASPPRADRCPPRAPRSLSDSGRPAPELTNDSWLNADQPLRLAELRGRVVLLNFWVFTCANCTRSLPALMDFDARYRDRGLLLIGIHTPEFPPYSGEHDKENVRRAVRAYGIMYPVAQDNDRRTWNAYATRYWPSYVLIDRHGRIRYEGYGEFHERDDVAKEWSRRIERLLAEQAPILRVNAEPITGGRRLTLVAAPGAQINARVKPALELANGTVLRFDSPHVTADSAYFTDAPTVLAPIGTKLAGAVLRASVCPAGERVCRMVTLAIDL